MTPGAFAFAEIYDEFAADYERTRVPRFRPFVKTLLQLFDARPKSSVLDLGTGTGLAATYMAPRVGHDGRVIGVDVSEKQLEIARLKAKSFGFTQCDFRLGDANDLDFSDGEFDLVISSFALNGEPAVLFKEMRRVLKGNGGVLLCQEWSPPQAAPEATYDELFRSHRVGLPAERLGRHRAAREELREHWEALASAEDYARLLKEFGFRQVRGHTEVIPQHFENAKAYLEWRGLEPVHKEELEAMAPAAKEQFLDQAVGALTRFETEKGLIFDWAVVQIVAHV